MSDSVTTVPTVQGEHPLDVVLGAAVAVARPAIAIAIVLGRAAEPLVQGALSLAARPPLVPQQWTPAEVATRLALLGSEVRVAAAADLAELSAQTLDTVVPSVVDEVLDRVDLTSLVVGRVDLERLVGAVLDTTDLTEVVLDRVDLRRVVEAALDALDLTSVVIERVDLHRVVETALDSLDLTQLVRDRVDVASLAEDVVDEIDLPDIIRESSTSVAGEVVDDARISAVAGDELVNRWVDRVLLRGQGGRARGQGDRHG